MRGRSFPLRCRETRHANESPVECEVIEEMIAHRVEGMFGAVDFLAREGPVDAVGIGSFGPVADDYVMPPAFGALAGVLGAIALAEGVL
jgi:hypothetical protein